MPILPEALIAAFNAIGGERNIREINDWLIVNYGDKWKDISTCMADMVPVSHGGSKSSQIQSKYRVLMRVSPGKYCLIKNVSYNEETTKANNKITKVKSRVDNEHNTTNYLINTPNADMLEIYSTKRLPYEPKGWQLELRNSIRSQLQKLNGNGVTLQAMYKSKDPSFFDVENVLFYNVGPAYFNHLQIKSLQFERACENPPIMNQHQQFDHYQSYKIAKENELSSEVWKKQETLANWKNVYIPILNSEIKPHSIWYSMKTGQVNILKRINSNYFGLEVKIKVPTHTHFNLVSVIKPLLDGIISAFHNHDSSDIKEVANRLKEYINLLPKEIEHFLLDSSNAVLGQRNLIQPYRKGVKWNPEDDAFQLIKIILETQSKNDKWSMDGEIFAITYIDN